MKTKKFFKPVLISLVFILISTAFAEAQTKKLKRPTSRVGVRSIDNFVRESFDLYDKVYMYDGYAEAGRPLEDSDIDVLEAALDDLTILSESAPRVMSDINGIGVLKQGKATLQLNRSKKALNYSIKTAKKLLTENRNTEESDESTEEDEEEEQTLEELEEEMSGGQEDEAGQDVDENVSDNLEIYKKFDFVPGDKLLYFDDFSQDFIGDFPSKWNTNGSGEVVRVNKVPGNWFEIKAGNRLYYIPLFNSELPEEYTIEFDILTNGLDRLTSSTAKLAVIFDDNITFNEGDDMAKAYIPFCQYSAIGITIQNKINRKRVIYSTVQADIRKDIMNQPHISIAVNKRRFRLWVNQKKYIDVPQLMPPDGKIKYLKFQLGGTKDGKDQIFISNLKVAEGGVDLRRVLMSQGEVSTNGILFDSGSATIKPQSYGIIRQISQVLLQDDSMRLMITGHTDSDGGDDANLKLSKDRAAAVKDALINVYNIAADRLETDGKGESEPVGDNSTSDGKAQNRRVVFKRI